LAAHDLFDNALPIFPDHLPAWRRVTFAPAAITSKIRAFGPDPRFGTPAHTSQN
jgi:hypothetical protein